jgi:hypothetical protein
MLFRRVGEQGEQRERGKHKKRTQKVLARVLHEKHANSGSAS